VSFARIVALTLVVAAGSAQAETLGCTVVTPPVKITQPGHYCLVADAAAPFETNGVTIEADDVTLDCNAHTLRQLGPARVSGIQVTYGARAFANITVRRCRVDHFFVGIQASNVHELELLDNDAVNSGWEGLSATGVSLRVEGNRVSGLLGAADLNDVIGIAAGGSDVRLRDNVITNLAPMASHVYGIHVDGGAGLELRGNTISGMFAPHGKTAEGISARRTRDTVVADNLVMSSQGPPPNPYPGMEYDGEQRIGIDLGDTPVDNRVCAGNTVGHFATNFSGCILVGNTGL
jgi:hypothetical protein